MIVSRRQLNMWPKTISFDRFTSKGKFAITFPKNVRSPSIVRTLPFVFSDKAPIYKINKFKKNKIKTKIIANLFLKLLINSIIRKKL